MLIAETKIFLETKCDKKGFESESNVNARMKAGRARLMKRIEAGEVIVTKTDKSGKLAIMPMWIYEEMGKVHTNKDREIDDHEVAKIQRDLNKHARLLLKIFGVGEGHGERNVNRMTSAFTSKAEDVPLLSLLVKDHKVVKEGALPSTRPVIGISATMIARMSKLLSESPKRLADCVAGSDEMKSREHL